MVLWAYSSLCQQCRGNSLCIQAQVVARQSKIDASLNADINLANPREMRDWSIIRRRAVNFAKQNDVPMPSEAELIKIQKVIDFL